MATKLEGGDKALVARPLKYELLAASLTIFTIIVAVFLSPILVIIDGS